MPPNVLSYDILKEILDHQNTLLVLIDKDSTIVFANKPFLDYFSFVSIVEANEKKFDLYQYFDDTFNSFEELDQEVIIGKDAFIVKSSSVIEGYKLFSFSLVTKLVNERKKLQHKVRFDTLTGVYKKSYFDILATEEINHGRTFALLVVDIDDFKQINDIYGHQVGDSVLVEFASVLKRYIRTSDYLARWGGEEFLILMKMNGIENAIKTAQKLCKKVANYSFTDISHLTASFGLAYFNGDGDLNSLLYRADKALYKAKKKGKNKVVFKK